MAFVATQNQEEDQQGSPVQTSNGGGAALGGGGGTGSGVTSVAPPTGEGKATGSGNFTNLQAYLDGNRSGASQLAGNIAGGVNSAVNTADWSLANGEDKFRNDILKGTVNYDPNFINQAISDPTGFASNSSDMSKLATDKAGVYSGPSSWESSPEAAAAQSAINKANSQAALTTSDTGRTQLLQQYSPNAKYTGGGLNLDSYLLDRSPGAISTITDAGKSASNLTGAFNDGQSYLDKAVSDAVTRSTADGQGNTTLLNQAVGNYRNQIDNAVKDAQVKQQQQFSQLTNALGSGNYGNVDSSTLGQLGVSQDQWNNLVNLNKQIQSRGGQGINLGNYLTNTPGQFTEGSIATPEQVSYYNALMQLAGGGQALAGGGGNAGGSNFNYSGALNALQAAQAALPAVPTTPISTGTGGTGVGPTATPPSLPGTTNPQTIPVPGSNGYTGYAGGGSVGIGNVATQTGANLGTVLGLAGNLGKAASGAASGAADASSGLGLSTILGGVGAGLAVYNFGKNWSSGNYVNNGLNGAEAGAAIGTLVMPGIGTLVGAGVGALAGAASSIFGPGKTDPETQVWNNYLTQDQTTKGLGLAVDNPYIPLAGMFDEKSSSVPLYSKYGRMGEQKFTNDLMSTINSAVKSGAITSSTPAETVYDKVVAPWVSQMGDWGKVGPEYKQALGELLLNMTGQYLSGSYAQNWKAIGGDTPFASSPTYGGGAASPPPRVSPRGQMTGLR